MKIANINFNKISKGLYQTDDKKGIVIDIYDFTDTKQKTPSEEIEEALLNNLRKSGEILGKEAECLIFRTGEEKDPWYRARVNLDVPSLCHIFPKVNALLLPREFEAKETPNGVKVYDFYYFGEKAFELQNEGNLRKAEYYYKWAVEVDSYWGNKDYGDFLVERKRYKEAEKRFLEIVGPNDISGDGNAHYAHLLLDTERYDEAIKYYEYVLRQSDTSPREGICVRIETLLYESDQPIWKRLGIYYFNCLMSYYTDTMDEFIEDILLARLESDDEKISKDAKKKLFTLYSQGKYLIPGLFSSHTVELPSLVDLEKAVKYSQISYEGDLDDPDNPFWTSLDTQEFNETLGEMGIDDIYKVEKMLQNRANSSNDEIKRGAMLALLRMYYEGHHYVGSAYCDCIGDYYEMRDFDKVCESSKVFVEFPDTLEEYDCDWTYFNSVMYFIENDCADKEDEYKRRFIEGIIKYAEEKPLSIDKVMKGVEDNLSDWYNMRDDNFPFYLGYIPKGVTFVPTMSFHCSFDEANTELTSVVIPDTIEGIRDNAFNNCVNLTSVTMPKSLEYIGYAAFEKCSSLESIVVPKGITDIEEETFGECVNLKSVLLPNTLKTIGQNAFWNCSSLEDIVLPQSLERVESGAFGGCLSLKTVRIPKNLTDFAHSAFVCGRDCDSCEADEALSYSLERYEVDNDNQRYCSVDGVLYSKDLTTLISYPPAKKGTAFIVPDTVTAIETNAFFNCSLESVYIPSSVIEMSKGVFGGPTSLKAIYCEAEGKPDGWQGEGWYGNNFVGCYGDWLGECKAEIIWNYKK